jgi:subtilisin family serine protease
MGANIINLSLGGSYSAVILSALQYAVSHNVLVVAAAGNEYASTPGYPARFSSSLSSVISVGAYDSSGTIASFSDGVGNSGAVQVDAPGVGIYSTYPNDRYATMSGTSMAAPHVAGLAALALSANHNLTAAQLRNIIVAGANDTISGSDSVGGINAAMTVALALSGQTSSSTSGTTASAQAVTQVSSFRRFMASSAVEFNDTSFVSASPAATTATAAFPTAAPATWTTPQTAHTPARVVDTALAALMFSDELNAESVAQSPWNNGDPAESIAESCLDELLAALA